jgi:addiction module RelE/StbE family toxin
MAKYEISITEVAGEDLAEIIEYIANDNSTAAIQLADEIEQRISQLEDFPSMGANPRNRSLVNKGYKILIVKDYLVFYVLTGDIVEIRRIISGKRNYVKLP